MKKIVAGAVALVCAASMFAADFAAKNKLTGSVAGGDKDSTYIWKLNSEDQKDADALVVSVNSDNAGAQMQFWYKYDGKDNDAVLALEDGDTKVYGIKGSANQLLRVRSTKIWFKPVDMLKITVGDLSTKLFGETLHYWKDPAGTAWNQWYNGYSGYGTVEAAGIEFELTPVSGLLITGGIASGTDTNFVSIVKDTDTVVKAYGVGVSYDLSGLASIPLTVGAEFRDAGTKVEKVLGIGAKYGNRYGSGFYGMVEGRLRMNEDDSGKLNGITINNHFRYSAGAFEAQLRAPVTIRLADNDPSWLAWSAKVSYALDGFTPYFLFGNDLNNAGAYKLDDMADTFGIELKPGVTLNVGAASIDLAALIDIAPKCGANTNAVSWSIPFEIGLAF